MDEAVFRALADPSRRRLLDRLFERDGQTLTELEQVLEMTRFGVMKHLRVLESAHLITTRRVGREKLHYLNPTPIDSIYRRWVSKYAQPLVAQLGDLKLALEASPMDSKPRHVFQIYIRTTAEALWDAITTGRHTREYFHATVVDSAWAPGAPLIYRYAADPDRLAAEGEVLLVERPSKLMHTFRALWDDNMAAEKPARFTWEIEAMGDVCRLTVVQDEFEGETAAYHAFGGGMPAILSSLKSYLETGSGLSVTAP